MPMLGIGLGALSVSQGEAFAMKALTQSEMAAVTGGHGHCTIGHPPPACMLDDDNCKYFDGLWNGDIGEWVPIGDWCGCLYMWTYYTCTGGPASGVCDHSEDWQLCAALWVRGYNPSTQQCTTQAISYTGFACAKWGCA